MSAQLKAKPTQLNVLEIFVVTVSRDTIFMLVNLFQLSRMAITLRWRKASSTQLKHLAAQVKAMSMKMLIAVTIC